MPCEVSGYDTGGRGGHGSTAEDGGEVEGASSGGGRCAGWESHCGSGEHV